MDNCLLLMMVALAAVTAEILLLLNVHRFVKEPEADRVKQGGEVKSGMGRVQVLRLALGSSVLMLIVIFAVVLNGQGCLA